MDKNTWPILIVAAIAIGIVSSLLTTNLTGNVIKVAPITSGTSIYTKAEIDTKITSLNTQISNLTTQVVTLSAPKGSLAITTYPGDAAVYIDEAFKGKTPLTITDVSPGLHTLRFSLSGFNAFSTPITIYQGYNYYQTALSQIQYTDLSVTSNPSGAELYVDGMYKGLTPANVTGLTVAIHEIRVSKTGYITSSINRSFSPGYDYFNVTLAALPPANLTIVSNPTGANLYIDSSYKGITPITVGPLSVGVHSMMLSMSGYDSYNSTIYLNAGSNSHYVTLAQMPTAGNLTVTSNPTAAKVYVDGSLEGTTPLAMSLSLGQHVIRLSKTGYRDDSQNKSIVSGANTHYVTLVQEAASLTVYSSPSGANLTLDAVYKGLTPTTAANLTVGNHVVALTKIGYNSTSRNVYLYNGSNVLNISMY
jgi:hypothetical protein